MFLDFKNIYLPLHKFSCFNSKAGQVVAESVASCLHLRPIPIQFVNDTGCYLCDSVTSGFAIGAILAHFEPVFDVRIDIFPK